MPTFAAVDIGSNSVRLKIARLEGRRLRATHEDREVTRLGEGVFRTGFLTPDSIAETVKVLRRFHRATQQIVTDSGRGRIRDTVSLPLGAVRLTDEFLRHDPPRKGELKRLRGFIAREVDRISDRITSARVKNVIATSGTAAALAATASHLGKNTSS